MTRDHRIPALLASAFLLLAPSLAPVAGAYKSTPSSYIQDQQGGDEYYASAGAVSRDPVSQAADFSGNAWVEYAFWIMGPGDVSPDQAGIDSYTSGPGSCRWQVFSGSRGTLADTGWRSCDSHWEDVWSEALPAYTGTITLRISYQGSGGAVFQVNAHAWWGGLVVSVTRNAPYSSADISELRVSGTPGTCLDVPASTTPSHVSVLDVDWGDGTTSTYPARAGMNDFYDAITVCHAYAPSTVPYQMCARVRETNGLQRATPSDCRDLPFMLPTV